MTFGLGYFQDGVWVDHLTADDHGVRERADESVGQHDASPIDVVHQLLSCCADPAESADAEGIGQDRDSSVAAIGITLRAAAGTAQR
jgi:hypothetical protein